MDHFLGPRFNHTINRLESDLTLLRKLLYRNRNQHGNTLSFSFSRRVCRLLSSGQWGKDCLLLLPAVVTEALRVRVGESKLSQEVVQKVTLYSMTVAMTISVGSKAIHYAVKAFHAYSQLLRKQVFLPLFTVLWSIMARLYRSVKELVLPLYEAHQHITSLVQNITLTSKYSSVFTQQILAMTRLSPACVKTIEHILAVVNPNLQIEKPDEDELAEIDAVAEDMDLEVPAASLDIVAAIPVDIDEDYLLDDPVSEQEKDITPIPTVKRKKSIGKDLNDLDPQQKIKGNAKPKSAEGSVKKRKKDDIDDIFGSF